MPLDGGERAVISGKSADPLRPNPYPAKEAFSITRSSVGDLSSSDSKTRTAIFCAGANASKCSKWPELSSMGEDDEKDHRSLGVYTSSLDGRGLPVWNEMCTKKKNSFSSKGNAS